MANDQDKSSADVITLLKAQLAQINLALQGSLEHLQMCQQRLTETESRFKEPTGNDREPPAQGLSHNTEK